MTATLHAQIDPGPPEAVSGYLRHDAAADPVNLAKVRPVDDRKPAYNPATHTLGPRQETIEPTQVVWSYELLERPLAEVQDDLCARIDSEAGGLRRAFTTTAHGQPEAYIRKQIESQNVKDDPAPTAAAYPLLNAGIGPDVPDTGDLVADLKAAGVVVEDTARAWAALAEPVEKPRLDTKRNIEAAQTVDEAWTAYQARQFPTFDELRMNPRPTSAPARA